MNAEYSPTRGARTEHRFYERAPIAEVILQFDFPVLPTAPETLRAITEDLRDRYPNRESLKEFSAQIEMGPQGLHSMTTQQPPAGYQLSEANRHRLVRVVPQSISFHEVQLYQGWPTFLAEAQRVFSIYSRRSPRDLASRIGLRYINRIDLPRDAGDLREWVLTLPDIPAGLPQLVSSFSSEMAMPQPDLRGVVAIMRQALLEPTDPSNIPIILDVEMVSQFPVSASVIWDVVESLHDRENLIFERTITDRVRGMIA